MSTDLSDALRQRIDKKTSTERLNRQLGLENLKRHSFENSTQGNTMGNASVRSGSVEDERLNGGKPTLIPFIYGGKQVEPGEAVERALASGRVWPSFMTNEGATLASKKLSNRLGRSKE